LATNPPEIFDGLNGLIAERIALWHQGDGDTLTQRALESKLLELQQAHWTIRVVYSPPSFQVGLFLSFIGVVLLIFLLGVWLWRLFITAQAEHSVARVARNSLAPILLNLFNRGIDFAFAFVMLRILGPEDAGFIFMPGLSSSGSTFSPISAWICTSRARWPANRSAPPVISPAPVPCAWV
jgi:hypothetical protein